MRVAAVDQGTTSTRCLVIEDGGKWRVADSRRHAQYYPAPGRVEHDPEELLRNVVAVLQTAGPVDAIGIANQGESCLAWDARTGAALSPVIVWKDTRTLESLRGRGTSDEQRSKDVCGLPLDPYFSASKLGWLIRNISAVAAAYSAGRLRLGTTDSFFLDRLCGSFATDSATASRTGLLDLRTGAWSSEMCELHGVPLECLPSISTVDGGFGKIGGAPVKVSIVDQQSALYGHNCRNPGDCKITFGTGAFLLAISGREPPQDSGLTPTLAWHRTGAAPVFALEGGVYDAGGALEWARNVGFFSAPADLEVFEGSSALSRRIVFVPALSGLAAPYWDRRAAPLLIGMEHATDRRDLIRAILEGIAMLTVGLLEAAAEATQSSSSLSIDGGLSQSPYFVQFLASASNRVIVVPEMHELTALGLAELCGVEVGSIRSPSRTFTPDGSVSQDDHRRFGRAMGYARGWKV